ncbi:squalene--hopene cyclase [Streptomyces sp. WAC 06725]|uniref:squalene--hopene cyclase n=1 Tax=Streptomyces sp. WAC 06725 TaxID=2203209 RepID=UPI000F73B799|nr:squalene--hopene cyclase [Streptomyces sp. WAC 06725]RSO41799.1 squalene--hopene cyclase [Streptomyces sp. WAC 06725]
MKTADDAPAEKNSLPQGEAGIRFASPPADELEEAAQRAVVRATDHWLPRQSPEGWWMGFAQCNMGYDAQDLFLRHFLGLMDERVAAATGRWIRSRQSADGTWPIAPGGPGDLGITLQAYVALRLAGDSADEEHMLRCAAWVREQGGVAAAPLTPLLWLAMLGRWSWDDLPEIPPEIIALPTWAPLNIYAFNSWGRQVIVALSVISAHRPARPVPFGIGELFAPSGPPARTPRPGGFRDGAFRRLNGILRFCRKGTPRVMRRVATNACTRWLLERQEADGSWGGVTPMTAFAVLALHLHGYSMDHPALRTAMAFVDGSAAWPEDGVRKVETVQSPVWDTCWATTALADAGLPADHPALVKAADWLLGRQTDRPGDWAVRRPGLAPGGWAFVFHNQTWPDNDDTAEAVLALRRVAHPEPVRVGEAVDRAVRWSLGLQCEDGGWAGFEADVTSALPGRLPFLDIGDHCVDAPTADVTAHVVEMLVDLGLRDDPHTRRGVRWLLDHQEDSGAWYGRWGVNYLYGTGCVLPALVAAGIPRDHSAVRHAVTWLKSVQNADGGWGEDWRSYTDPVAYAGRGPSTPSQTSWALIALLAAGERDSAPVRSGVRWLTEQQTDAGSWQETAATGAIVPPTVAMNYECYRHVFPLMALGRYAHHRPGGAR